MSTAKMGREQPIPKKGRSRFWRSFLIEVLSDKAKRPMHHRALKIALRPGVKLASARYAKAR